MRKHRSFRSARSPVVFREQHGLARLNVKGRLGQSGKFLE